MPFSATRDLWLVLKARDEASRAMGAFSRDIRMVGDSVRLANLQAARSAAQNQLAIQRMTGASQNDMLVTQRRIQQIDQEIGQMKVYKAATEEQRVSSQRLATALQGAAGMATAIGTGMIAAGAFGVMGLKNLVDASVEYQKQSALTATQVDKFATSVQDIEKIGLRVANSIGVPFEQIQPALFDIFSSMEVGAADAEKLLTIFSKAAVAGQTDIQNASKATIGILNAFHLPLEDVNHLMDVQFQLVKEGIGTYDEWSQRIGLVTPSAVRFGQSVDMMAAALAASTRMGISAARSATAVSRAMDAMSNPIAVENLTQLGIAATDADGNFRPMIDILFDFRKALDGLPEETKIKKILDVFKGAGGTIEARRFLQNMLITPGNLELFQQIFATMSTTTGSFEQAYSIMSDTIATKSQLISNKWNILKVAAGTALAPSFIKVLDVLGKMFDAFNKLSPQTQKLILTIIGIATAGSILVGILLLILGLLAGFAAAIATAGAAIFVVTGIVGGLVAGLILLGSTFIVAYKKSSKFRDLISEISDLLTHIWKDVIVPFAQEVTAAFETHILPALQKLRDVIARDVLPIVIELIKKFKEDFLPILKDIANFVKDRVVTAFEAIGYAITNIVIPALEKAKKFYEDHKKTINEIIKVMAIVAGVMVAVSIIVGTILAVAFGGPIVAIILGFIALIAGVIYIVVKAIEIIKNIIDWFKHFGDHMSWLGDKISGVWKDIRDEFDKGVLAIRKIWSDFWSGDIGRLLLSAFNVITGFIDVGLATIESMFFLAKNSLIALWNGIWDALISKIVFAWNNAIVPFLSATWDTISSIATKAWNIISSYISGIWDGIWSVISDRVGKIVNGIKSGFDDANRHIINMFNDVKSFLDKLHDWFFESGQHLIDSFIDGMTSKFNELGDKLHILAQKIRDFFPHSPAKVGPLSGKGGMYFAGQNMVTQLYDGINSKLGIISSGSSLMASAASTAVTNGSTNGSGGNNINQNITVNTQELNPKRQAAELGWLLVGSM